MLRMIYIFSTILILHKKNKSFLLLYGQDSLISDLNEVKETENTTRLEKFKCLRSYLYCSAFVSKRRKWMHIVVNVSQTTNFGNK